MEILEVRDNTVDNEGNEKTDEAESRESNVEIDFKFRTLSEMKDRSLVNTSDISLCVFNSQPRSIRKSNLVINYNDRVSTQSTGLSTTRLSDSFRETN